MKFKTLGVLAASVVVGATVQPATAAVSHIFGHPGKQYTFDSKCHRITFVQPGIPVQEEINVLGQQVKCLVRLAGSAPGGGGGQGTVGVCLDGRPDKNGYQDIKVCDVGDEGFIGSLIAPA